ncbi:hypothetical protein LZZ90_00995 [Flavobacterium sp. SM15]|uniref:hypothetical protein n=1 Tax=Flavobacterium sp. SM15 TaxID=2908005 RepID=UPI001EDB4F74|nr:hypothetical protein [Flavobacterium sp. SM15]MCG2610077.1 hypothetical protein [Flavobacterium sp. SM15]
METVLQFIKQNRVSLILGLLFYGMYLYFTFSGNRICDCETTENYRPTTSGTRGSINHFYHK